MEYQFTVPDLISELLARAHIADIVSERWGSAANQGGVVSLREAAARLTDFAYHELGHNRPPIENPSRSKEQETVTDADHIDALTEALGKLMVVGSAATGHLMCDFSDMHGFIEEIMKRPVWTHEMGQESIAAEIREKAKQPFVDAIEQANLALNDAERRDT